MGGIVHHHQVLGLDPRRQLIRRRGKTSLVALPLLRSQRAAIALPAVQPVVDPLRDDEEVVVALDHHPPGGQSWLGTTATAMSSTFASDRTAPSLRTTRRRGNAGRSETYRIGILVGAPGRNRTCDIRFRKCVWGVSRPHRAFPARLIFSRPLSYETRAGEAPLGYLTRLDQAICLGIRPKGRTEIAIPTRLVDDPAA